MPSSLELIPARLEQRTILANLLELYIHDFSELVSKDVQEDGRFGYSHLALYWSDSSHQPFLARYEGKWAGFVLVQREWHALEKREVWDMAEFFVLRRFRRKGIGTEMAMEIWRRFPGSWQVRVRASHGAASRFWESGVGKWTGQVPQRAEYHVDGVPWYLFSFRSNP